MPRRISRAPSRVTKRSELAGPLREVVYIIERDGAHGGALWWLVLECGHSVTRKRPITKRSWSAIAQALFRPLEEKLAPRRAKCNYCGSNVPTCDPAILIKALGGV